MNYFVKNFLVSEREVKDIFWSLISKTIWYRLEQLDIYNSLLEKSLLSKEAALFLFDFLIEEDWREVLKKEFINSYLRDFIDYDWGLQEKKRTAEIFDICFPEKELLLKGEEILISLVKSSFFSEREASMIFKKTMKK